MSPPSPVSPHHGAAASTRVALLIYTLLIIYASWYPLSGWRSMGVSPFAYLWFPLPHYWTMFDVLTNIVGYAPFGALVVFTLHPRVRGTPAWLLATLAGILLSTTMEAVQTYLPNRVPSNLDLLTNAAGSMVGAAIGVLCCKPLLEQSALLQLRHRWFSHEASRGLIVIALWPLAQIYPQGYLFGNGQLLPMLSDWLSTLLNMPVDLGEMLRQGHDLEIEQYWLAEAVITACGTTAALLTLLCLLRPRAPKAVLAGLLFAAGIVVRSLASALQFTPDNAFVWLTPGAETGLLCCAVMITGLVFAPPAAQRRVAAITLLISIAAVNIAPSNPYFASTLQDWAQGRFINFNGAARFLSLLWPFFTLWFLLHPVHRRNRA